MRGGQRKRRSRPKRVSCAVCFVKAAARPKSRLPLQVMVLAALPTTAAMYVSLLPLLLLRTLLPTTDHPRLVIYHKARSIANLELVHDREMELPDDAAMAITS